MPFHPQVAAFLDQWMALQPKRIEQCAPREIRENMRAAMLRDPDRGPLKAVHSRIVDGPEGPIPVRIYRAHGVGTLAAIVFFHGGVWVAGDLDTHDVVCRALAATAGCVVIAVDYRLAPEHAFPRAAEDAYAATQWVFEHSSDLEIDVNRITVAGDSAGGNLAAVVPMMARDRGARMPSRQVLIYPITDSDFQTESYEQFAEGHLLTRSAMQWFWDQYVPSEVDRKHPYVVPLRARDLRGLPPALVITAECDVLRDEGEAYAARLLAADVPTELIRYDGMIHGFLHRYDTFDAAPAVAQQIAAWLR